MYVRPDQPLVLPKSFVAYAVSRPSRPPWIVAVTLLPARATRHEEHPEPVTAARPERLGRSGPDEEPDPGAGAGVCVSAGGGAGAGAGAGAEAGAPDAVRSPSQPCVVTPSALW